MTPREEARAIAEQIHPKLVDAVRHKATSANSPTDFLEMANAIVAVDDLSIATTFLGTIRNYLDRNQLLNQLCPSSDYRQVAEAVAVLVEHFGLRDDPAGLSAV